MYDFYIVNVDISNLIVNLENSSCKRATNKASHTPALHFIVKAYFGVIHVTGKRMHVCASNVTLSTHNADALSSVKSLFDSSLNPTGPVGAKHVTVYSICMKTVVKENYRIRPFSVKAQNVNSLVELTYCMVNIGIVNRRASLSCAVLHFVSSYVCDSVGSMTNHISHLRRLKLFYGKNGKIAYSVNYKINVFGYLLCIYRERTGGYKISAGVSVCCGDEYILSGNVCALYNRILHSFNNCIGNAAAVNAYNKKFLFSHSKRKCRSCEVIVKSACISGNIIARNCYSKRRIDVYCGIANLKITHFFFSFKSINLIFKYIYEPLFKILYLSAENYLVNIELVINDNKVGNFSYGYSTDFVIKTYNSCRVS